MSNGLFKRSHAVQLREGGGNATPLIAVSKRAVRQIIMLFHSYDSNKFVRKYSIEEV